MVEAIPSPLEVEQAVFSLAANKSSSSDGFLTFFFQMIWNVVHLDVTKEVQE
ncbi:hypothetical protein [Enterobacter hormaechei]|uniref:hypothetical protein n=1 Tax=Enterobacter hormaechei TaxID=158836 RepID=UPI0023E357DF|nr:hypothetical protein [Enterobacter hormaechei]MDF3686199.1 hypothetical protein [Enterobacter hormaechei]